MGKWTEPDSYPGTHYPDYCNGNMFALNLRTGLYLAEASTLIPIIGYDDTYLTGVIPDKCPDIKLTSLAPIGGSLMWDKVFSYCPILSFLRYSFNPIIVRGGSKDMQ